MTDKITDIRQIIDGQFFKDNTIGICYYDDGSRFYHISGELVTDDELEKLLQKELDGNSDRYKMSIGTTGYEDVFSAEE